MGNKSKPAGEIIPTDSDRTSLQEFFHCLKEEKFRQAEHAIFPHAQCMDRKKTKTKLSFVFVFVEP